MRNRLFQESHARDCQEFDELRRICCEEADRERQARIDDVSVHQERNPTTVSQLLTQIHDLQNKVNSLTDARDFYDPSQLLNIPSPRGTQPLAIPSTRRIHCRDSVLPLGTRNSMGT